MSALVERLFAAANNPDGEGRRPRMLSVGDSVMWGQGLRPENRFRELVRRRLSHDRDEPIIELSLARSGALLAPDADQDEVRRRDEAFAAGVLAGDVPAVYAPEEFAREVPHDNLTSRAQLELAYELLNNEAEGGEEGEYSPEDVELILLDGGANDVGIFGFLLPLKAYQEGYGIRGWNAWLIDEAEDVETEMADALRFAVEHFENAVVVVTGYYPVFSYESVFNALNVRNVGVLYGVMNVALPFAVDALATASAAWQAASNRHLRRAVATVRDEHPDRTVLFARSNIEGVHSLFAPDSWLWEHDSIPDEDEELTDALLGATAVDEVETERRRQCRALADSITCRIASIGHPNVEGSRDYAESVIAVLEDAGVLDSELNACARRVRRAQRACTRLADDGAYRCIKAEATVGEACDAAVTGLASAAGDVIESAGRRLDSAGAHLDSAVDCFADADAALRACDAARDAAIARCESTYAARSRDCDAIRCNSFTNCGSIQCTSYANCTGRYAWYDPRRYACQTARAACVAAAAVARASCHAARAACVAAAATMRAACLAAAVAARAACRVAAETVAVACKAAALAERTACAAAAVAKAAAAAVAAVVTVVVGVALAVAAGAVFVACGVIRFVVNRTCRLGNWAVGRVCGLGVASLAVGCRVGALVGRLGRSLGIGGLNASARRGFGSEGRRGPA